MRKRDLTRTYTRAQFAAKLRRLADAIETGGTFTVQVAGERLTIPASVAFNIEHERSGSEEELEFQLLWRQAAPKDTARAKGPRWNPSKTARTRAAG